MKTLTYSLLLTLGLFGILFTSAATAETLPQA